MALCQYTLCLWDFCVEHNIHLEAADLPGTQNVQADCLSRTFFSHHEWSLHLKVVRIIFPRWGFPQVDLFAPRQNRKCPQFCSLNGHILSFISDAFLISWSHSLLLGHIVSCMPSLQFLWFTESF